MTTEARSASGNKLFYRRRFLPEALMAGLDPNAQVDTRIHAFWDRLQEASVKR